MKNFYNLGARNPLHVLPSVIVLQKFKCLVLIAKHVGKHLT